MRSRILLVAAVVALGVVLLMGGAHAEPATFGKDAIVPGQVYRGDFPDPAVLRVGAKAYAYSTTSGGLNVPILTSTDLHTWRANSGTVTNPTGDALPRTATWSDGLEKPDGRFKATTWAPTVTRLGPRRYVMAYATAVAGVSGRRMCVSVATASTPTGPFVDQTTRPTICPARGAIDPQIFIAPSRRPWLVWKIDHYPAQIFSTPMNADGVSVSPGTKSYYLAGIKQAWEGRIIEGPAMITYKGRIYLFYSANSYASSKYAIGYLICKTWYGDCHRPRTAPLMASGKYLAGPGGPMPFVDAQGHLRLAYHAWSAGAVGYASGQRRLYVATLRAAASGHLHVDRWN